MSWYKDRDFPELKAERRGEPAEILAHIPDPKHLNRVVEAHNEAIEKTAAFYQEREKAYLAYSVDLVSALERIKLACNTAMDKKPEWLTERQQLEKELCDELDETRGRLFSLRDTMLMALRTHGQVRRSQKGPGAVLEAHFEQVLDALKEIV